MVSWQGVILLALSVSAASSRIPSSNTQTFMCKDLKVRTDAVSHVRAMDMSTPKRRTSAPKISDSLLALRENLIASVLNNETYMVEEVLYDMYAEFPDIDHINVLYEDEQSGGARGLIHLAVTSGNSDMFDVLEAMSINSGLRDSFGYTAIELAIDQGRSDLVGLLISKIKSAVHVPFGDYDSVVHYAAAHGRVDLLKIVRSANIYCFSEGSDVNRWSPLEMALNFRQLQSAKYLIERQAFYRPHAIRFIYLSCFEHFLQNFLTALFMCAHFNHLLYVQDSTGMDLMLHAVDYDLTLVVASLFDLGFDHTKVEYDLLDAASNLTQNRHILDLIRQKLRIK